jgi:hypothetical protein
MLWALANPAVSTETTDHPDGDPEAGRLFYWEGLTRGGEPVKVSLQGDLQSTSANFSCVGCHRPSGFGSSEGGTYVPPVTGPILFGKAALGQEHRNRLFQEFFKESQPGNFDARVRMPRSRPSYTGSSFTRALRTGIDPAGRSLDLAMPRYNLDDQTAADLYAFMKTLSPEISPGVTEETLHIATVISDGTNAEDKEAFLSTITKFVAWYNQDINSQLEHPGFSPFYRSEFKDSYRNWKLHVWELEGGRETWPQQLRAQYDNQPVFALVSGLVSGSFAPVDTFCNAQKLPCIFPNTELPSIGNPAQNYTLYFSRGLELEGKALAYHLLQQPPIPTRIAQIHTSQAEGQTPARAFENYLTGQDPKATLTNREFSGSDELRNSIAAAARELEPEPEHQPEDSLLVLWPGTHFAQTVAALNEFMPGHDRIMLPSGALEAALEKLSPELREKVRFTYPYEKPSGYHPRAYRIRAWMHTRGLAITSDRLQMQTYYALSQLQYTVSQLIHDFYRDYLIESIERVAEAELNPGTHPSLALGPNQRFASKGAYIMQLTGRENPSYRAVSDWLVP